MSVTHDTSHTLSPTHQVAEQHVRAVFYESLAGTQPYPSRGTSFEVTDIELLSQHASNRQLEAEHAECRRALQQKGRSGMELEEQYAFVGCR